MIREINKNLLMELEQNKSKMMNYKPMSKSKKRRKRNRQRRNKIRLNRNKKRRIILNKFNQDNTNKKRSNLKRKVN